MQMNHSYAGRPLYIRNVLIPEIVIDNNTADLRDIFFQEAMVTKIDLGSSVIVENMPRFMSCYFSVVEGRASSQDMPAEIFPDCEYDYFDTTTTTTDSILQLETPLASKVLLTILKKLYAQRGTGRRESALFRGLDQRAQRLVPDVLDLLRKHGFAVKTKLREQDVWLPAKSSHVIRRARQLLAAPSSAGDILLQESEALG